MKVGDYVMCTWPGLASESRKFGLILSFEHRTLECYTQEDIDRNPVRRVSVLQIDGKIRKWYAINTKVISESR